MKRILVVDDDKQARALLRDILSPHGYEVLEASDGQKALEILQKEKVDLLITDRAMPVMDGLALLKVLREEKCEIPTIMVSAYGEESFWAKAVGLGAEDYILKPFATEDVMRIVKKKLK
jgi:CheY-like chemotaxis protein